MSSEAEADCQKNAMYAIPIFVVRVMSAVFFSVEYGVVIGFLTIPVAFILSVTICCIECDKKTASKKAGLSYFGMQILYIGMQVMAISQASQIAEKKSKIAEVPGLVYAFVCLNILLDVCWINRHFWIRLGNKYLLGSYHEEFHRIKAAKKQMKFLREQINDINPNNQMRAQERKTYKKMLVGAKMGKPLSKEMWISFKVQCNQM